MTDRRCAAVLVCLLTLATANKARADVLIAGHRTVEQVVSDELGFTTLGDDGVVMTWTADDVAVQAWTQLEGVERIATSGTHVLAVTASSAVLYERRTLREIEELAIAAFTECAGANGIWYWADDLIQYVGASGRVEIDYPDAVPLERAVCAVDNGHPTLSWYEDGRAFGVWPTHAVDPVTSEIVDGVYSEPALISSAPWTHPADPVAVWADGAPVFLPSGENTSLATSADGSRSISLEPPRSVDPTDCAFADSALECADNSSEPFALAAGVRVVGAASGSDRLLLVEAHGWTTMLGSGREEPLVSRFTDPALRTLAWGADASWVLTCTTSADGGVLELVDLTGSGSNAAEEVESCDVRVFSGADGTTIRGGRELFDVTEGDLRRVSAGTAIAATPVIAGTTQRFVLSAVHDPACGQRAVELRRRFADGDEAWLSGPLCASAHWVVPYSGTETSGFALISQSPSSFAVEVWSWSGDFVRSETRSVEEGVPALSGPLRVREVDGLLHVDDVSLRTTVSFGEAVGEGPLWLADGTFAEPNGLSRAEDALRVWVLGEDALVSVGGDVWCSESLQRMLVVTDREGGPRSFASTYVQNRWDAQLLGRIAFP